MVFAWIFKYAGLSLILNAWHMPGMPGDGLDFLVQRYLEFGQCLAHACHACHMPGSDLLF